MYNSRILSFTLFIISKTKYFYKYSLLAKVLKKLNNIILTIFQASMIYKLIINDWDKKQDSILNKFCNGKERINGKFIYKVVGNSSILIFIKNTIEHVYLGNVRYIGITLFIFSALALFKGTDYLYGEYIFALNIGFVFLGIVLFIINTPIKNIFEGSKILKLIYNLFTVEE